MTVQKTTHTFKNGNEMFDYIIDGNDIWNRETGQYIFAYNNRDAIAVYDGISPERAEMLRRACAETGEEYWGSQLGPGGSIYDPEDECGEWHISNIQFCNENFAGVWEDADVGDIR